MIDKFKINKILLITLSNIGDVLLTLPVVDVLRRSLPPASLTVMVGPRAKGIFEDAPWISKLVVYNKHSLLREKMRLIQQLRKEKFDLVIDLKNTILPLLLRARYKTTPFIMIPETILHMKDRFLYRLEKVIGSKSEPLRYDSLYISAQDKRYVEDMLTRVGIKASDKIIAISPGANSELKRWPKKHFSRLCERLMEKGNFRLIIIGDEKDKKLAHEIIHPLKNRPINLCGMTNLKQVAALLGRCSLFIGNDSGLMHMGSYLDTPILAIFGPSDPSRAGPWNKKGLFIYKKLSCSPCKKSYCNFNRECLTQISPDEVYETAKKIL